MYHVQPVARGGYAPVGTSPITVILSTEKGHCYSSSIMTTEVIPAISERQEAAIRRLRISSEAGEFDGTSHDTVDHLISQLPDGYALDEECRVIRLDPSLPNHIFVASLVFGVPSDPVRIPVHT